MPIRLSLLFFISGVLCACGGGGETTGHNSGPPGGGLTSNTDLYAVAYHDGVFVGVGQDSNYNAMVETSTDGVSWVKQSARDPNFILMQSVVSGKYGFLAVDRLGSAFWSPTGVSWENVTPPGATQIYGPCYNPSYDGSNYLIAFDPCGQSATDAIYTSSTGNTPWTTLTQPASNPHAYGSIVDVAGTWYAIAKNGGTDTVATSTDLVNWNLESIPFVHNGHSATALLYTGSLYMIVGGEGLIATSPDGVNWTDETGASPTRGKLNAVAWNGSVYVAVGDDATVVYSTDGTTWKLADVAGLVPRFPNQPQFLSVAAAQNGAFVVAGPTNLKAVDLTSTDGIHWVAGNP